MHNPRKYWDQRYRDGRSSGAGSEGAEAEYKAAFISEFIRYWDVHDIIDWGCGDGHVLSLMDLNGAHYTGIDVSPTVITRLSVKYAADEMIRFKLPIMFDREYDLALSLDVLFHLPSDIDYRAYLIDLFDSSDEFVIIYSTDYDMEYAGNHVRRRNFTADIAEWFPSWELKHTTEPLYEGAAQFFVYNRKD